MLHVPNCILMIALAMFISLPSSVFAQGMMGGNASCPMCGAMGWGGMILGGVLILAVIAALVALTIFLIRRSRLQQ